MKTTFIQTAFILAITLSFLFSGCDSSNGVLTRGEVIFDSITEIVYTKKKMPLTGVIVEEYVDKNSGESIQRQININEGVITGVTDLKADGQVFKNYPHRLKEVKSTKPVISLSFLTEDMKDTVSFYKVPSIKNCTTNIYIDSIHIKSITYNKQGKIASSKDLKTNIQTFYDEDGKLIQINNPLERTQSIYEDEKLVRVYHLETNQEKIYEDGKLTQINNLLERTQSIYENEKLVKVYHLNKDNKRAKEILYKNGKVVKTNILIKEPTVFDNYGIELVTYRTGFYNQVDYNSRKSLWVPMIILKLKNISGKTLTRSEQIKVLATFIEGDEELATDYCYVPSWSDGPWADGITRQIDISSRTGFVYIQGIVKANIKCKLYVNDELYKTIRVQNKELISRRIN